MVLTGVPCADKTTALAYLIEELSEPDHRTPTEPPFEEIDGSDTVLDLALAPDGNLLAVGEEWLHQGITTVDVVTTDGEVRSYSVPSRSRSVTSS